MPFLRVETNIEYNSEIVTVFLKETTEIISKLVGKPKEYVMCRLSQFSPMSFGGNKLPSVYMEMKSVGLTGEQVKKLAPGLTELAEKYFIVPADNVYIEFNNAQAAFWSCGGAVLG